MKILAAAINARFNHTNIAVRSIVRYVQERLDCYCDCGIEFAEWTINMSKDQILRGMTVAEPDMVLFSTYIWNSEMVQKIIPDIKKILPHVIIGAGGPEAGFCPEFWLRKFSQVDFIMAGEGEETVLQIALGNRLEDVAGLYLRKKDGNIFFTGTRELICDLDQLPFPYDSFEDPEHRIYYYESSRGCPFSCSYCMSSMDRHVRFRSVERTCHDIQKFLDANVSLVKFVDRTYNLNEERYLAIWQYILDNHNGKTMFHFEIEAEFLSEKALCFIEKIPSGIMQFEIGVQSCNEKTLEAVGRSKETARLFENIKRIPETIHRHLDLIAGLPYEDLGSFGESFDRVMKLKPDALQLGFLKVLHGTTMKDYAEKNGWQWMEGAPYEVLSTPYLSFVHILFLKDVEILLDAFYNKGIFRRTMDYVIRRTGCRNFFFDAAEKARADGTLDADRKTAYWFDWLARYLEKDSIALELLKFDFLSMAKTSRFPVWMKHNYDKSRHLDAMNKNECRFDSRIEFAFSEYDEFTVNPASAEPEKTRGTFRVLFVYERHNSSIINCQIILQ